MGAARMPRAHGQWGRLLVPWLALWLALSLALWLAMAALGLPVAARAQAELPVPPLSGRVIDQTGTLTEAQSAALDAKLAAFESQAGPQIVVLLVATTQPEDIAAFAQRVADSWKIGRRDVGDGLLLVVAKADRRVRIEVAKALEGAVPDLAARQIIDQQIRPAFRADDYAGGLNLAVDALTARIRGEGLPAPAASAQPRSADVDLEDLGLFFFVLVPIAGAVLTGLLGRRLGSLVTGGVAGGVAWWLTATLWLALAAAVGAWVVVGLLGIGSAVRHAGRRQGGPWIGTGGSGGFGGGGWGGGGGFSSGGGGDFGGGGASGDW